MAKKAAKPTTPAEYLDSLLEPRKSQLVELDALIRKTVPSLSPYLQSGILAYGTHHYVYTSGKEGDCPVVGLSSRANYISLYICASDEQGHLAEQYKSRLPKANVGRGCIRFKRFQDLDLAAIKELLKKTEKWAKAQAKKSAASQQVEAPKTKRARITKTKQ